MYYINYFQSILSSPLFTKWLFSASLLIKLNETQDMNIINIAFKVLCQESSLLTRPEEKDLNTSKGLKDSNNSNDPKSSKDTFKDSSASKGSKDSDSSNDLKSSKDPNALKCLNNLDSSKDQKGLKDSNAPKVSKDSDSSKDPKSLTDSNDLKVTPKKQNTSITEDGNKEESLCEIQGTPTGRLSPIIQSKKTKNNIGKSTDFREKKKLPDDW